MIKENNGILIVAPKGVIGTWYNQRNTYSFTNTYRKCDYLWQSNITKEQSRKLGTLLIPEKSLHILISIM